MMEFECKLAHQDTRKRVSSFVSIKELYKNIADQFNISASDIMFCTLNTNNPCDMDKLLANCLSLGDLIVAHVCDYAIDVELHKARPYLGLTITDNGFGRAFVKKIRPPADPLTDEHSVNNIDDQVGRLVKPGDHIESINGVSMLGLRHFEVAKSLKAIPIETNFTIRLVRPKQSPVEHESHENQFRVEPSSRANWNSACVKSTNLFQSNASSSPSPSSYSCDTSSLSTASQLSNSSFDQDDLTKSSLPIDRLLSTIAKGPKSDYQFKTGNEQDCSDDRVQINRQNQVQSSVQQINRLLESFIGISDNQLAIQIYRLASQYRQSPHEFLVAVKSSDMQTFCFSDDFIFDLWASVSDGHTSKSPPSVASVASSTHEQYNVTKDEQEQSMPNSQSMIV